MGKKRGEKLMMKEPNRGWQLLLYISHEPKTVNPSTGVRSQLRKGASAACLCFPDVSEQAGCEAV